MIDQLKVLDGYQDGERWHMRGINGHAVNEWYRADGLRSMARIIGNQAFTMTVDNGYKEIFIPQVEATQMTAELFRIADALEGKAASCAENIDKP